MRNFEIPLPSDATGEGSEKDKRMKRIAGMDADRIVEERLRRQKQERMEDVERGLGNADVYQPDTQKIDPDRIMAARKKEEEAKAARIAREQKMKAEDQKKIEEIRSSLGLSGASKEIKPLLEGDGWHEVPTKESSPPLEGPGWHEVPTPPPAPPEQAGKKEGV